MAPALPPGSAVYRLSLQAFQLRGPRNGPRTPPGADNRWGLAVRASARPLPSRGSRRGTRRSLRGRCWWASCGGSPPGTWRPDSAGGRAWRRAPRACSGWTRCRGTSRAMGTTSRRHLHVGETQGQSTRAAALGLDDGRELVHRFLHVTVDDQVIVLPPRGDLLLGAAEAPRDVAGGIAVALAQPRLQLGHRGRHDEDRDRLRVALAELPRPVGVDVEEHVEP